jgi:murein DD-endopeptidase MepM/ murein hydrolase activator NlpD
MIRGRAALLALVLVALAACGTVTRTGDVAPYRPHVAEKIAVSLPEDAPSIMQEFMRFTPDGQPGHLGLDIGAPIGTPVRAAASGRVYLSYFEPKYGNRIVIDHGRDRDGRRVFTVYKHLDSRTVQAGDVVKQGQTIGGLGDKGIFASYPHLHFEVLRETEPGARTAGGRNWWQGMQAEDPNLFWAWGVGQIRCAAKVRGGQGPVPLVYPVPCREG